MLQEVNENDGGFLMLEELTIDNRQLTRKGYCQLPIGNCQISLKDFKTPATFSTEPLSHVPKPEKLNYHLYEYK